MVSRPGGCRCGGGRSCWDERPKPTDQRSRSHFRLREGPSARNRGHARGRSLPCWPAERHGMGEPEPAWRERWRRSRSEAPGRQPMVGFLMGRGDDTVTVNGGPGFDGPLGARFLILILGEGADHYRGSHSSAASWPAKERTRSLPAGAWTSCSISGGRIRSIPEAPAMSYPRSGEGSRLDRQGRRRGDREGRSPGTGCGGPGSDRASLDAIDRARSCEERVTPLASRLAVTSVSRRGEARR